MVSDASFISPEPESTGANKAPVIQTLPETEPIILLKRPFVKGSAI